MNNCEGLDKKPIKKYAIIGSKSLLILLRPQTHIRAL